MKRFISLVLTAVLLSTILVFAGCGKNNTVTINVYNWGEYIDMSALKDFEKETGIRVNYQTYANNEEMYSKISSGAANYDVIIPSDYMISKMIDEEMLAPLNFENIPNYSLIGDAYKNLEFDPENQYSVPYTWGTVVIMYDKTQVDAADIAEQSVNLLWNEKYKNKILMFDNPRDAFALAQLKLGYSMNSTNEDEWKAAAEELKKQKPLVQAYVMDQIFDKMGSGEAAIAPYYAGDGPLIQESNPNVEYYIPREGTNLFVDAMCIPKNAQHQTEAEQFINFMCATEIALKNQETIGYASPQVEASQQVSERLRNDPCIYADENTLKNTESFMNLPKEINVLQSQLWTDIKKD